MKSKHDKAIEILNWELKRMEVSVSDSQDALIGLSFDDADWLTHTLHIVESEEAIESILESIKLLSVSDV